MKARINAELADPANGVNLTNYSVTTRVYVDVLPPLDAVPNGFDSWASAHASPTRPRNLPLR